MTSDRIALVSASFFGLPVTNTTAGTSEDDMAEKDEERLSEGFSTVVWQVKDVLLIVEERRAVRWGQGTNRRERC